MPLSVHHGSRRSAPAWAGIALAGAVSLAATGAGADIAVGVAGPMSGSLEPLGRQMLLGAEAAVRDLNAAGGVLGETVVLESGDDGCDERKADALANQMAGRGIVFMAGHLCSLPSIAAARVYAEQGIVQISPGATLPRFTDHRPGPGTFRLAPREDLQGVVSGRFLADAYPDRNVAILHDGTTHGRQLANATQAAMQAAGKFETLSETFVEGERDFAALVDMLQRTAIGVVYFGGRDVDAGLLINAMREAGLAADLVGSDSLASDRFRSIAEGAGDGVYLTYPPDPTAHAAAADLVQRFRDAGVEPEGYVLPTYAAVQAWAQAVTTAGTTDHDAVAGTLAGGTFATVLGRVRFDQRGDADIDGYAIHRWSGGTIVQP